MKVLSTAVIILVLTASSVLWGKDVPKKSLAFPASDAARLNCSIKLTQFGLWNLRVQAMNPAKHKFFNYLYSIHDNVKDSMKDCATWMQAVKEEQAKERQLKR